MDGGPPIRTLKHQHVVNSARQTPDGAIITTCPNEAFVRIWQGQAEDDDYNRLIDAEPIIAEEGDYPDGLLLIRNGFARVSRRINHGHYTLGTWRRTAFSACRSCMSPGKSASRSLFAAA